MNESRIPGILFGIATVFLIISVAIFMYSGLNTKNIDQLKSEHLQLEEDFTDVSKKNSELSEEYKTKNDELYNKIVGFNSTYGYDYNKSEDENLAEFKSAIESENSELIEKLKSLIKNYEKYYSGEYYGQENFDEVYNDFDGFLNISDKISGNISEHSKVYKFMENAAKNGTAKKLYDRNRDFTSGELAIPIYLTIVNSSRLYQVSVGELSPKDVMDHIHTDILNTYFSYINLEELGYNLGELSIDELSSFVLEAEELFSKYNENIGVLQALEVSNEEK